MKYYTTKTWSNLIWSVDGKSLPFENWLIENNNILSCIMVESDTDKKSDYNYKYECEKIYDAYHLPLLWYEEKYGSA